MNQEIIGSYAARFNVLREQKGQIIDRLNFLKEIESEINEKLESVDGEANDLVNTAVREIKASTQDTSVQVEMAVAMAGYHKLNAYKIIRELLGVDLSQAKDLYQETVGLTT